MSANEDSESIWPKKRNVPINDVTSDVTTTSTNNETHGTSESSSPNNASSDNRMDGGSKDYDKDQHGGSDTRSTSGCCCACYIPKRYIITFMLGFAMLLIYSMRTNVGVTVVMILDEAPEQKVGTLEVGYNLPNVDWGSRMVGLLHSVFYIGHIMTQLPGAYLTTIWPSQRLFGLCILISALLNLLLPISIQNGQYVVTCLIRVSQGLAEGLLYPSCYGVLRHWSAPNERSRTVSVVLTCGFAGAILGFPVGGIITHCLGWHYVFYVCGGACVIWYLFWVCFAYEKPSHHTSISDKEYEFMEKTQGQDVIDYENVPMPWMKILTSFPVIAICFCHFTRNWIFILMLTNEPSYLNEFGFNIAMTGFYASLPHIALVLFSLSSGIIADMLLNSNSLTRTSVRKLLTGIGFLVPTMCFIMLTFLREIIPVIIVLTIAIGGFGLSTSGWSVNHYDISTRHASSLVAVSSTFGAIGSILSPLVAGVFTANRDIQGWDNVFYSTAGVIAFSGLFYIIFASGVQQPWANPHPELQLVPKVDPLARKPYKLQTLPRQSSVDNASNNANDKTALVTQKYGHGYGTGAVTLNKQLSSKLETK